MSLTIAQTEAPADAPSKVKVSKVTPADDRKQPKGLNAWFEVRGDLSGLINSVSMGAI